MRMDEQQKALAVAENECAKGRRASLEPRENAHTM